MDRSNHYEAAFEAYLQWHRLCYVAVDETRRAMLGEAPLKSLDFIVFGGDGARLVVDVKGRRFPAARRQAAPRLGMLVHARRRRRAGALGRRCPAAGYRGLLVFTYHVLPSRGAARRHRGPVDLARPALPVRAVPWPTTAVTCASAARSGAPSRCRTPSSARWSGPCTTSPAGPRRGRGMSGLAMNRLKIGIRLESLGLPLRRALPEAGTTRRRGRAGRRGRRPVAAHAYRRPAANEFRHLLRVPQPGTDRPGLSAAPRPGQTRKTSSRASTTSAGARPQLRPRPRASPSSRPAASPSEADDPRAPAADRGATGLGRHGDRVGAVLALETGLESGEVLAAFLDRFDTGGLGVEPRPGQPLDARLRPLRGGPRLARPGRPLQRQGRPRERRQPDSPGSAAGPRRHRLDALLAVLEEIEYRGWLTVARGRRQPRRRRDGWRGLPAQADRVGKKEC